MSLCEMKGVVLKVSDFGESSLLIHIYTDYMGLIKTVLKGGRKQKARTKSAVQPLTESELVIYRKSGRELQYIKTFNTIHSFTNIRNNPEKLANSLFITEHILSLIPLEEPNRILYDLLINTLDSITNDYGDVSVITLYFRIRLLRLLGTLPYLKSCIVGGDKLSGVISRYVPYKGGFVCDKCFPELHTHKEEHSTGQILKIRNTVLDMIHLLSKIEESKIDRISPTKGMLEEANRFISFHINYHHETTFKTERFLKGMGSGE
jgi:DNA repair protein RecO (recombination protein O)